MRYRTLGNTGLTVSAIGFGGSPLGDVFGITDPDEDIEAVHAAVDQGVNLFDVSPYYGETLAEERLGRALLGIRQRVILATKCGRYGAEVFDFSAKRVKRSIDESLTRLRTDHVDLFLAHDIEFAALDQIVTETIPALRAIQRAGKARFVGITGYPLPTLISAARRVDVDVILSYCHYNLLITDLESELVPFAKQNSLGLINASPLHMGLLGGSAVPPWHPAPLKVRSAAAKVVELCREQGIDPAIVALAFCLKNPDVSSTLVGMSTREQVNANLKALTFEVNPSLAASIEQIVAPARDVVWSSGRSEQVDSKPYDPKQERPQ